MSSQSSIKRLKLCSLGRLQKMSDTLSGEITKLNQKIDKMEEECNNLAVDEGTVVLQEYHGEYLLKFDRMEYEIDGFRRKVLL